MGPRACSRQSDRIRAQFKLFAYRLAAPRAMGRERWSCLQRIWPEAVPSNPILL